MSQYYIYRDGKEQGPFSLDDLKQKQISADTLIRDKASEGWRPAGHIEGVSSLFLSSTETPLLDAAFPVAPQVPTAAKSASNLTVRLVVGSLVVLMLIIGAIVYSQRVSKEKEQKKEWVRTIHEQEVQKTLQEQKAERIARKQYAEARKAELARCKASLQSLYSQLGKLKEQREDAVEELDHLRRPHLFRSRARKENQLAELESILAELDRKERRLQERMAQCRQQISQLSDSEQRSDTSR